MSIPAASLSSRSGVIVSGSWPRCTMRIRRWTSSSAAGPMKFRAMLRMSSYSAKPRSLAPSGSAALALARLDRLVLVQRLVLVELAPLAEELDGRHHALEAVRELPDLVSRVDVDLHVEVAPADA